MKRVLVFLISVFLLVGCANTEVKEIKTKNKIITPKVEDENEIVCALYKSEGNNRVLAKEINEKWVVNKDITVLTMIPVLEESLPKENIKDEFYKYFNSYKNSSNYKIGYQISFEIDNERNFSQTILKPEDTYSFYDYVQVYLYDDINNAGKSFYSHVEKMEDNTILTSIKLTGSTYINNITSPIELTVFTYKDESDFNKDNKYIGKSLYKVIINNK